jgi:hypothetical protein
VGSNIFLVRERPRYQVGYGVCLGAAVMAFCLTIVLYTLLKRENAKRERVSEAEVRSKYTETQLVSAGIVFGARLTLGRSKWATSRRCSASRREGSNEGHWASKGCA